LSVDHVAAVVEDLDKALRILTDGFGFETLDVKDYPEAKIKAAFVKAGNTKIELIEPTGQGPYLDMLKAGFKGMNHIAIEVEDMEATISRLRALGVEPKDKNPRFARGGKFLDLKDETTVGIRVQLFESGERK